MDDLESVALAIAAAEHRLASLRRRRDALIGRAEGETHRALASRAGVSHARVGQILATNR